MCVFSDQSIFFLTDGEFRAQDANVDVSIAAWNRERSKYDALILTYDLFDSGKISLPLSVPLKFVLRPILYVYNEHLCIGLGNRDFEDEQEILLTRIATHTSNRVIKIL